MSSFPQTLGRFVRHDLMTTDLAKALTFYKALFPEWTLEETPGRHGGTSWMIGCAGYKQGEMVALDPAHGVPSHWIGYVAVENCDQAVAKMSALGGRTLAPALNAEEVGRVAVVADPLGAAVKPFELAKPIEKPVQPTSGCFCWDELGTSDINRMRGIYQEVFDWKIEEFDMGPSGLYTIFKVGDEMVAGGMNLPKEVQAPPNWLAYIAAEDIDARALKVGVLGGETYVAPQDIPEVGRFSVHADPVGGVFALFRGLK